MPKPLSLDLRSRVLAAVDGGLSCCQAAERFGVSASSAIRWVALKESWPALPSAIEQIYAFCEPIRFIPQPPPTRRST
jgi:hypothetical protein